MKNWMKVLLIVAACLAGLGILLGGIGFALGGNISGNIPEGMQPANGSGDDHTQIYEIPVSGIRDLELNWVAGNVILEPYDGETIRLEEHSSTPIDTDEILTWSLDGSELKIDYMKKKWFNWNPEMQSKDLRIQVPNELAHSLGELEIHNVSAAIHLKDLKAGELEVETVSGDVKGLELQISEANMESVSGDLTIQFLSCPGELGMETVSGDAEILIPAGTVFRAELDSVSGEITSELPYTAGENENLPEIEMNSVSGDLRIRAQ